MPRRGFRICELCGTSYLYGFGGGGTKYCSGCRHQAKLDLDRSNTLLEPSFTDGRRTAKMRAPEYNWLFACSVCGMKHPTRDMAEYCCAGDSEEANSPIYMEGGFWWLQGIINMKNVLGLGSPA